MRITIDIILVGMLEGNLLNVDIILTIKTKLNILDMIAIHRIPHDVILYRDSSRSENLDMISYWG